MPNDRETSPDGPTDGIVGAGRRARRVAVAVAIALIGYTAFGFLAVPALMRWQVRTTGSDLLGRPIDVAEASFNPFTLDASLGDLQVHHAGGEATQAHADRVDLRLAWSSLWRRTLIVEAVALRGVTVSVVRDVSGRLDLQDVIDRLRPDEGAEGSPAPWSWSVDHVALADGEFRIDDRIVGKVSTLESIAVDAHGLTSAGTPMTVSVHTRVAGGGTISVEGEVDFAPSARFRVLARDVDLAPFGGYLRPWTAAEFQRARADVRGELRIDSLAPLRAAHRGGVSVHDFRWAGDDEDAPLFAWRALDVPALDIHTSPLAVTIDEATLEAPQGNLVLERDGSLNLLRRLAAPQPESGPVDRDRGEPRQAIDWLKVGRIRVDDGTLVFTDLFFAPNYTARLDHLSGSVSSLSSTRPGNVQVSGRVNGQAPFRMRGRLQPMAAQVGLDLEGSAQGISLPQLSPYAVRYLGYRIRNGELSAQVRYRLQEGELSADNHVTLVRLELGDRVKNDEATSLPVQLAVGLLKDERGVIDLDLPVTGSLDDPDFNIRALVGNVIGSVVERTLKSPFRLLGRIAGGDDTDLGAVEFPPGTATLDDPQRDKLRRLITALERRPTLKVRIIGTADRERDGEAIGASKTDEALRILARDRARNTRDFLGTQGRMSKDRLSVAPPRIDGMTDDTPVGQQAGAAGVTFELH